MTLAKNDIICDDAQMRTAFWMILSIMLPCGHLALGYWIYYSTVLCVGMGDVPLPFLILLFAVVSFALPHSVLIAALNLFLLAAVYLLLCSTLTKTQNPLARRLWPLLLVPAVNLCCGMLLVFFD